MEANSNSLHEIQDDQSLLQPESDFAFMEIAFEQSREALKAGEVPIGCAFIHSNEVMAVGRNTVNETKNATRHAEINALDTIFEHCTKNHFKFEEFLQECTLFVTVEPCIMCAQALLSLKLGNLVFGCKNNRFGGCGSVYNVFEFCESIKITSGVREKEAIELLKDFYKGDNPNTPIEKAQRKK